MHFNTSALHLSKTYHAKDWIKNDDNVWIVDPKEETASIRIVHLRSTSKPLLMVTNTVVFCHTKKFKKTNQGHICMVSEGKGRSQGNTRGK